MYFNINILDKSEQGLLNWLYNKASEILPFLSTAKNVIYQKETCDNINNPVIIGSNYSNIIISKCAIIFGGKGHDMLIGYGGNNTFTGSENADLFIITEEDNSINTIMDFTPQENGEKIIFANFKHSLDISRLNITQGDNNTYIAIEKQLVILTNFEKEFLTESSIYFNQNLNLDREEILEKFYDENFNTTTNFDEWIFYYGYTTLD